MARRTSGGARQWSRTAQTRRVLLHAAGEVFAERGFAEASVASVVERAGSSVGSIYHHFGGKTELYLALWEEHQAAHEEHAAQAVAGARAAGETDPIALFIAGARGYLEETWERRGLTRLFHDGDGPPGFELMRRSRSRAWIRQNSVLLGAGEEHRDRLTVAVLTAVIAEAARELTTCETEPEAREIIGAAVDLIRRLGPVPTREPNTRKAACASSPTSTSSPRPSANTSATATGTPSPSSRSTSSPRPPATASGSTSTRGGPRPDRSAPPSPTDT